MASVNTNVGAMIALQNLNKTNSELEMVQNRINTGLKVATAKDDGGIYAIAQRMRSDVAGYSAVTESLNRVQSTVDVALAAGEAVSDLLIEMKEKAIAASDTSLDAQSRSSLNIDFQALRDQITNVVNNANFNGVNLINNGATAIEAITNVTGGKLTVAAQDLSLTGTTLEIGTATVLSSAAVASGVVSLLTDSLNAVNNSLTALGTASKSLGIQSTFVSKLSDALETGIGNLVDADLAKESSRLQALQVKQQLGVQALSIANAAPSTVLGFFR